MRTYISTLVLSLLFDIGSTLANVLKYDDPYLRHETNFMLQGKYWPWLIAHGFVQFFIVYVLFSIGWKHRTCLMPNMKTMTFWTWCNSCLYGQYTQSFEFKLPKWKNVGVFLLLIILMPIPLLHVIWGLHNTLVLMECDISSIYQHASIFIFGFCMPFSIVMIYKSIDAYDKSWKLPIITLVMS